MQLYLHNIYKNVIFNKVKQLKINAMLKETKKRTIKEIKTQIYKGFNGWTGKTVRIENGRTFEISTLKTYGGCVTTTANEVKIHESNGVIATEMDFLSMTKSFLSVNHGKIRATENTVKNAHFEALALFDEKVNSEDFIKESQKEEEEKPTIGTILFLDGYGKCRQSAENQHIVYKIDGANLYTVEKTTFALNVYSRVRNINKKFGIGTYFKNGYSMESFGMNQDDLNNLLIEADKRKKADAVLEVAKQKAQKEEEIKKANYLAQFKKADKRKTTHLIKKYIKENFPTVQKVEVKSDSFSMGSSLDVYYYAPEQIKEINPFIKSLQYGSFNSMEDIYEHNPEHKEVIIYGHILEDYKYTSAYFKQVEAIPTPQEPTTKTNVKLNLTIQKYSDKAGVIFGNTKPIKDDLKALGCRFNNRLTIEGEKVAGWIFPISKIEEIKNKFL